MNSKRTERLASQFVREVSDILRRKLGDPRLQWVTVTRAEVAPDLRTAKVFIQTLEPGEPREHALAALRHAEGFIRRELGHRLELRLVPEIHFFADDELERTERMLRLMDELGEERGSRDGRTETGS